MPALTFPLSSMPGRYPGDGQGRLVNCYAEKSGDRVSWKPTPGLIVGVDMGLTGPRGMKDVKGLVYAAYPGKLLTRTASGDVSTLAGNLVGSTPVSIAHNNRGAGAQAVIVDVDNGAFIATPTTVISYSDPDLPQPNSVAFLDGFFIFTTRQGGIWASDLNDTPINALSFANAEAKPDGLLRGIVWGGQWYGFGEESIEIWQNVGSSPFPLARSTVIAVGLASSHAVAGDADGWGSDLIFAASDNTVRRLAGVNPQIVSTPDVERALASVSDKKDLRAEVFTMRGNMFWVLSSPEWSWAYNVTTGLWHEMASYGMGRWRVGPVIKSGGVWIGADALGSALYTISEETRMDGALPLVSMLISETAVGFPNRATVSRADFQIVPGVGLSSGASVIETIPRVAVSWSDDGGATWSTPLHREIGQQGEYRNRVTVNRTGLMSRYGRAWKIEYSDPRPFTFLGGDMQVEARRD